MVISTKFDQPKNFVACITTKYYVWINKNFVNSTKWVHNQFLSVGFHASTFVMIFSNGSIFYVRIVDHSKFLLSVLFARGRFVDLVPLNFHRRKRYWWTCGPFSNRDPPTGKPASLLQSLQQSSERAGKSITASLSGRSNIARTIKKLTIST